MARDYLKRLRRRQKRERSRAASRAKQVQQAVLSVVERSKLPTLYEMLAPSFIGEQLVTDPPTRGMLTVAAIRSAR